MTMNNYLQQNITASFSNVAGLVKNKRKKNTIFRRNESISSLKPAKYIVLVSTFKGVDSLQVY